MAVKEMLKNLPVQRSLYEFLGNSDNSEEDWQANLESPQEPEEPILPFLHNQFQVFQGMPYRDKRDCTSIFSSLTWLLVHYGPYLTVTEAKGWIQFIAKLEPYYWEKG